MPLLSNNEYNFLFLLLMQLDQHLAPHSRSVRLFRPITAASGRRRAPAIAHDKSTVKKLAQKCCQESLLGYITHSDIRALTTDSSCCSSSSGFVWPVWRQLRTTSDFHRHSCHSNINSTANELPANRQTNQSRDITVALRAAICFGLPTAVERADCCLLPVSWSWSWSCLPLVRASA